MTLRTKTSLLKTEKKSDFSKRNLWFLDLDVVRLMCCTRVECEDRFLITSHRREEHKLVYAILKFKFTKKSGFFRFLFGDVFVCDRFIELFMKTILHPMIR